MKVYWGEGWHADCGGGDGEQVSVFGSSSGEHDGNASFNLLFADDEVTCKLSAMEDLWTVAVAVFQLWIFVVVFFITLPAMFGLSLGVTSVYIQILVKLLEVSCPQRNSCLWSTCV